MSHLEQLLTLNVHSRLDAKSNPQSIVYLHRPWQSVDCEGIRGKNTAARWQSRHSSNNCKIYGLTCANDSTVH